MSVACPFLCESCEVGLIDLPLRAAGVAIRAARMPVDFVLDRVLPSPQPAPQAEPPAAAPAPPGEHEREDQAQALRNAVKPDANRRRQAQEREENSSQ